MSIIDHLTRLYKRRFFFNEVASVLSRTLRYKQPFSLLLMDLDHFKPINDTYGHDCGDAALKNMAKIFARFSREGDTLARYAGQEFVPALPNTGLDGANKLAERIRHNIEVHKWNWKGNTIALRISTGVSSIEQQPDIVEEFAKHHPQVTDLIREADRALYYVKQHGRNAVKNYHDLPKS